MNQDSIKEIRNKNGGISYKNFKNIIKNLRVKIDNLIYPKQNKDNHNLSIS